MKSSKLSFLRLVKTKERGGRERGRRREGGGGEGERGREKRRILFQFILGDEVPILP